MIALLLSLLAVTSDPPPPATGISAEVDGILTRLESRGEGVKDLRCKLEYTIDDKVSLDSLTKYGAILFRRADPHDVFMVHFEKLVQDNVVNKKHEWYLFKDRWLWEVKEASKSIIKREIVAPGEKVDLFDIDTAPFPVPFGQKKEQILRNFNVTLASAAEKDPPQTDHLVCIPKPGAAMARDFEKLEFFVSRALDLPVKVVTVELGGNKTTTAVFPDLKKDSINAGLTDKDFAPSAAWKKFSTIEEPLPARQPDPKGQ